MAITANRPSQDLVDIVKSLDGKWHGSFAMARCPAHPDGAPSLSLRQGNIRILVKCFAGCSPDAIFQALKLTPRVRGALAPDYRPAPSTANVARIWDDAREIKGTLAERYLKIRKLPLNLPDIRFHPRCPHKPKPHTEFKPALIVAVREGPVLKAIQRIFLDPNTGFRTEKVMLGQPGMAAWRPPLIEDTLAIAEGFEDAAAYTKLHGIVCWSALGSERLPLLAIPDSIKELVIAEDNNQPGRHGAKRAWKAYLRPGLKLRRHTPRPFEDWAAVNEAR